MIPVFVVGIVAAIESDLLSGVGTVPALKLSVCALLLFLLFLGARLAPLWSRLRTRRAPLAASDLHPFE